MENGAAGLFVFFAVQNAEFPDKFFPVNKGQAKINGTQYQNSDRFLACHGGSFPGWLRFLFVYF